MKIKKIMYTVIAAAMITCTAAMPITANAATKAEYVASGLDDATATLMAATDAYDNGTMTADQVEALYESYGTFWGQYPPYKTAYDAIKTYVAKYPDACLDGLDDINCINQVYTMGTYLCQQLDAGTITQAQCANIVINTRTDDKTAAQNLAQTKKLVAKYAAKNAKNVKKAKAAK